MHAVGCVACLSNCLSLPSFTANYLLPHRSHDTWTQEQCNTTIASRIKDHFFVSSYSFCTSQRYDKTVENGSSCRSLQYFMLLCTVQLLQQENTKCRQEQLIYKL
jgi:hypothetical protein